MEKIEELIPGLERMIAIIHKAFEELKELGIPLISNYPHPDKSAYEIETNVSLSFIEEMMKQKDIEFIRFENQTMVDVALQTIARKLYDLFKKQKDIRDNFERKVGKSKLGKVPRDTMRQLLNEELKNHQLIDDWKKLFSFLIEDTKNQGFEVFEREENKYQIYIALEINLWKATKDTELKKNFA